MDILCYTVCGNIEQGQRKVEKWTAGRLYVDRLEAIYVIGQ